MSLILNKSLDKQKPQKSQLYVGEKLPSLPSSYSAEKSSTITVFRIPSKRSLKSLFALSCNEIKEDVKRFLDNNASSWYEIGIKKLPHCFD